MLLKSALAAAIARLTAEHVGSPRLNAETLLMFTLGCDRAYLFAHPERKLTAEAQARYEDAITQRASGVPAQYITGHQEFWGMDFIVSPAVLVPRPETEHVIETVLSIHKTRGDGRSRESRRAESGSSPARIVDVGTGSGCIAVTLAQELPQAEIFATEISPAALEIARANAARHQLETRIRFCETDLLHDLVPAEFDFVVSNPPYVGESEEDAVQMEVRKFEPRSAVFAGPTGLEVIERLVPQAQGRLKSGGWLVMEISGTVAAGVKNLLRDWNDVQITNDLQGIPRVSAARRP